MKSWALTALGCLDNFLVSGIQSAVTDIVTDRAGEEEIVLCLNAHLCAETFDAHLLNIMVVDKYVALLYIVKRLIKLTIVVFPAPVGPTKAMVSPGAMVKLTSSVHW